MVGGGNLHAMGTEKRREIYDEALLHLGGLLGFDGGIGSSLGGLGSTTVALEEECGKEVSCEQEIVNSESRYTQKERPETY